MGATWFGIALTLSCSAPASQGTGQPASPEPVDAPLVAAQPGAWFDARGNLTVVGAGRRLRLVLSAPISACSAAFAESGRPEQIAERASLPFHVLSDLCRPSHPTILLPEESETASPGELERSYHEVARCAASELGLTEGWLPRLVAKADPCPLALGLGWRLPRSKELSGLTLDDRKAIAGALFDTEDRGVFGGLLLYSRAEGAGISLSTLSPNAAEQAPTLTEDMLGRPFFGAAVRCTRDAVDGASGAHATPPVLPHAAECMRELRQQQGRFTAAVAPSPPEVQKLKAWLEMAERAPTLARSEAQLRELEQLLAAPALAVLAREARDERSLTERYAELAESLDDPAASEAERRRRRDEFDNLRRRLGGQIVRSAERSGPSRSELGTILDRLRQVVARAKAGKLPKKSHGLDYGPVIALLDQLDGKAPP